MRLQNQSNAVVISVFSILILSVAAWMTHIIHCLMYAKYLLLIAGAFIAPVGVIHGVSVWFGAGW